MANMAQHLLDTAIKEGGRPALRMGDTVVTYDEFAHPPVGSRRRWPPAA